MANKNAISEIGDGRLVKMEVDYSETVDKAIPEAENKAKVILISFDIFVKFAIMFFNF